jgi:hypothetical protein
MIPIKGLRKPGRGIQPRRRSPGIAAEQTLSQNGWISLTEPDGNLLFTMILAGELYSLQLNDARTKDRVWAQGQYTKEEVREAFRQFRRGDRQWRTPRAWSRNLPSIVPLPMPSGCGSAIALALTLVAVLAAFAV